MAFDLSTTNSERAPIPTIKPDPKDEQFVREALSYLVIVAPFWAHLFYNEMQIVYVDDTSGIPFAATDGWKIYINVPGCRKAGFNLKNMAFVVAHEISHGFLGDLVKMVMYKRDGFVQGPTKKLPYDATMMNVAEDFRINAMLVEGKVGVMPPIGLYDKAISEKGMESSVEIYEKLAKQGKGGQGQGQGQGQGGGMGGHGGFDIHLDPSQKQQDQANSGRREQAIAAAVQAAQAAGKGNLPGAVMRMINEILEPVVPWQDKLKASMQRAAGDPTYDWRYLDKRLMVRPDPMYFARQAHNGCGTIVIVNDTSGSMTNQMIDRIMAENGGIIADLNPVRVVVVWCDSAIHNVNDLDEPEDVNDLKADIEAQGGVKGGGGTDFRPPFDWVKDHIDEAPDMLVYFTDTYGTFPSQEPEYPVIWGVIVDGAEVPWGEKIFIDLNAS